MKRLKYIILIFSVVCASAVSARQVVPLNSGWTFFPSEATHTDNAAIVNLPHTWNATAVEGYFRGECNYLKTIDIPLEWEGKRVFIRVGGATTTADIFADGRHVGSHQGGYTAFTLELTEFLKPGSSCTLRVVVNNASRQDALPIAGEENIYGGLFREVQLIVCEPLSVSPAVRGADGIHISTTSLDAARAEGKVRLGLLSPRENASARVRFFDHDSNIVAQCSVPVDAATIEVPFSISTPRLWQGTRDPYLYRVEIALFDSLAGVVTDSLTVRTGFRIVAVDPQNRITLNGEPLRIRGVVVHRDRAMVGTALNPFQIEEDVALIREMGANAVRVAGGPHSDYFYTLCDEAGLVVFSDLSFSGAVYPTDIDFVDTEDFKAAGEGQLAEMVSQLGNHPSIVAWGLFSDISLRWGDPLPWIRRLNALAHELDPGRLTLGTSNQDGEINLVTDLISFDLPFGWLSGQPDGVEPWLKQLKTDWSHLRAGISYGAGGSIFHHSDRLERPDPRGYNHPQNWQTFVHREYLRLAVDSPQLWGVFVGNMFDFGAARHPSGIDDRGLVTFDRKYRKEAFFLYKSAWGEGDDNDGRPRSR